MRRTSWNSTRIMAVLAGFLLLAGCNSSDAPLAPNATELAAKPGADGRSNRSHAAKVLKGPAVRLGAGVARTYIALDRHDEPMSIGVELSEKALEKLPAEVMQLVLRFHPRAFLPYTHVLMDWNPSGHEPPGTYDVPHFDFHFYFMPNAERLAIGPDDTAQFANAPDAKYIPSDYMQIPGGVPQMGAHWVDLHAPEFNQQPFSRTLIYGTYDGEVTFVEPMITLEYLRSRPNETIPIRQPDAFQHDGYYPESYSIVARGRPGGVRVSLDGLVFHAGE